MNFLLLMSDEHNPRFSSIYGHPSVKTPNMQRLADMGTLYENAYCNSPLCLPSRSSFMSGMYVHETQAYNNSNIIKHNYPSYGQMLSDQGVHTTYAGKVDVYNHSDTLGFNELLLAGNRGPKGDTNFQRQPMKIRSDGHARANGFGIQENPFQNDQKVIDLAIQWITQTSPNLGKPWSFTVNTGNPHFPHFVTQELWDMYPEGGDLPAHGINEDTAKHPAAQSLRDHFQTETFSKEQARGLRRGYLGCVTWTDAALGQLIDALESTGQLKDTVIVYCSDHGEMLGKFGMWWKCSLYEDSMRVPMIVAGPGFEPGKRVNTPVTLLDLQATFFKSLNADRPESWHGQPLQDVKNNDDQRIVFGEYHGHGTTTSGYMIRKGNWKVLYHVNMPHQLFNLKADPEELANLATQEPAILKELINHLKTICDPEAENDRCEAFIQRQMMACAKMA